MWHNVLATHMEPQVLAVGEWLGDDFLGCALPSTKALRMQVLIEYNGIEVICEVADVGPWCIDDDQYVFGEEIPRAQEYKDLICPRKVTGTVATVPDGMGGWKVPPKCNGAGIDLFPATAKALNIKQGDNVWVSWCFI